MNGRLFDGNSIIAEFWDGKTNYKKVSESKTDLDKRVDEFGNWLDNQELPEELKQKKEEEGTVNQEGKDQEESAQDNSAIS